MGAPRLIRYTGLAGAVRLAVAGRLGGAFPNWTTAVTPASIWRGEHGPLTVLGWLLGTGLLAGAWWAAARPGVDTSGGERGPIPSLRWAYVTAALWLLPLLVTVPMGSRDVYSYACQGWVYATGQDPYAAGVAQAGCPWLDSVPPIWRDTPAPYGPFFVVLAALAVALGGTLAGTIGVLRLLAVLGVLLTAACLPGLARRAGLPDRDATWLVLGCPLVGVHLVAGAHADAVMIGLLLAGLLVLTRGPARPGPLLTGGVLLGLAMAVKVTALVALPFGVLAALAGAGSGARAGAGAGPGAGPGSGDHAEDSRLGDRVDGSRLGDRVEGRRVGDASDGGCSGDYRTRSLLTTGAWVAGGALVALSGMSLGSGLGLGWIGGLTHSGDSRQWTSPPTAIGFTLNYLGQLAGLDWDAVPLTRLVALLVLAVLLPLLWVRTLVRLRRLATSERSGRERVRLALLGAGLGLAATVLLAPVFYPWYAIWPLAVLATALVGDRRWLLVPGAAASVLIMPDGTNLARFTKAPGGIVMTVLVIVLAVRAVGRRRSARRRLV